VGAKVSVRDYEIRLGILEIENEKAYGITRLY